MSEPTIIGFHVSNRFTRVDEVISVRNVFSLSGAEVDDDIYFVHNVPKEVTKKTKFPPFSGKVGMKGVAKQNAYGMETGKYYIIQV